MHPLQRLWVYARHKRASIIIATVFSVANKVFDILPEVIIGVLVDTVVKRESSWLAQFVTDVKMQLLLLGAITAAIWIMESTFEYLYQVRWRNIAQDIQHGLRRDTYAHVQTLPFSVLQDQRTGQTLAVLNDDINQLERFLNGGANDLIQVVVSSVAVSAIFFVLTPQVAVVAILPVPIILLGAFLFQRRLAPHYATVRRRAAELNELLANNLGGITTIRAFVGEEHENRRLEAKSLAYQEANTGAIKVSSAITPVIRMGVLAGFVGTLLYGGFLTLDGSLEVGAYSVLVFLTQRLLWPFTRLADMTDLYQRSMASARRALDLLDLSKDDDRETRGETVDQVTGDIVFDHVGLDYGDTTALSDVSLTVPAGQTVAFVGTTGSGKSSLLRLLLRLYDPTRGTIRLDGKDLTTLAAKSLRRHIGYVSQEVFLTDGTVADNIAYGSFDKSREDIVRAAQDAFAHDFITRLPQGYDAPVGERGVLLSGGQRQRIALARALLKDPPVLILDEATSAVDNETERAIQRSLDLVTQDRTTLIVAHRLSTIRHAHVICVLEHGEICERGTHDELLALNRRYAGLWRLQTGERDAA